MKVRFILLLPLIILSVVLSSCKDKDNDNNPKDQTDDEFTNECIQDKMKRLYLWNRELPAKYNYSQDSESFFYGILYKYGDINGDCFSWIEKDKSKDTKSLFGGGKLGFDYIAHSYFGSQQDKNSSVGFFVTYVREESDAYAKGLRRGHVIYQVNSEKITGDNYDKLLNDDSFILHIYDSNGAKKTLPAIQASLEKDSPIFLSKVITASNTKIGYLVYNAFERGPDENNTNDYQYDIELIEAIRNLNNQGITELILDLRYNPGGYLTSAMALASALVPNRDTRNIFVKEKYNQHFQDSIVKNWGADALNEYFLDKIYGTNVEIPRSNLSRLFVIAAEYSASASELTIHGLRPYMKVYHVGETTVGKDKASMTIKWDNKRIKWQLQPIISKLSDCNGKGDYIYGLEPDYEVFEWNESYAVTDAYYIDSNGNRIEIQIPILSPWIGGFKELGDLSEPLLAEAIAQITGQPRQKTSFIKKSGGTPKRVDFIKQDERRYKTLVDENKFEKLNNK